MSVPTQAQYSLTIRLELARRPEVLAEVVAALSRAGADVGAVDLVAAEETHTVRDFTVDARDQAHWDAILDAARAAGAKVLDASDRTFLAHLGGKIEQRNKIPVRNRDDLGQDVGTAGQLEADREGVLRLGRDGHCAKTLRGVRGRLVYRRRG